jgi:hypoxanthine-DNA glycosylase
MELHTIAPYFNSDSKILILGSFPSVKSRQTGFYYGHPQNRMWQVLADVFSSPKPLTIEDKKAFLTKNKIAMWDVIASCDIVGSADSSIKNAVYNDLDVIFSSCDIKAVYTIGNLSHKLYNLSKEKNNYKLNATLLPSTSPANAQKSVLDLIKAFSVLKNV